MMYSSNDSLGCSEGPTSSVTPELHVASGVSGMARRRSETMGDVAVGATSNTMGADRATPTIDWAIYRAMWGPDKAPTNDPTPCFTTLVLIKEGT